MCPSGGKEMVINTRERAVNNDLNRFASVRRIKIGRKRRAGAESVIQGKRRCSGIDLSSGDWDVQPSTLDFSGSCRGNRRRFPLGAVRSWPLSISWSMPGRHNFIAPGFRSGREQLQVRQRSGYPDSRGSLSWRPVLVGATRVDIVYCLIGNASSRNRAAETSTIRRTGLFTPTVVDKAQQEQAHIRDRERCGRRRHSQCACGPCRPAPCRSWWRRFRARPPIAMA